MSIIQGEIKIDIETRMSFRQRKKKHRELSNYTEGADPKQKKKAQQK